jgi:MFS family permease
LAKFGIQNLFTAYVAIALFSAPAYGWQVPLVGLAWKFGVWKVMIPGLFVAWISMFIFWLTGSISIILLAGVINGLGYAACMPTSQWEFSNEYNITYAGKNNLKQIDSNASAAPTKMLANLANVIGLALGWFILQIFGYTWTFFFLGFILFWLFFVSVFKGKKFKLY